MRQITPEALTLLVSQIIQHVPKVTANKACKVLSALEIIPTTPTQRIRYVQREIAQSFLLNCTDDRWNTRKEQLRISEEEFWMLAENNPLQAMESPWFDLLTLAEPERWRTLEIERVNTWIQTHLPFLCTKARLSFTVDCVERVIPLITPFQVNSTTPLSCIKSMRSFIMGHTKEAMLNKRLRDCETFLAQTTSTRLPLSATESWACQALVRMLDANGEPDEIRNTLQRCIMAARPPLREGVDASD